MCVEDKDDCLARFVVGVNDGDRERVGVGFYRRKSSTESRCFQRQRVRV